MFFGGGGQGRPADPTQDSAIRASMISQGLGQPGGNIPGSNVPALQGLPGGDPGMSTRQPLGMEGDAAMNATAKYFQQQMSRQLGTEVAMINREFGQAGRFVSGQRGRFIGEAQERAGRGFSDFLSRTALERYLQEQRLTTQADIAQAQIEAQRGTGRTQLLGSGLQSLATIFAQNPEWLTSLFTKSGPGKLPGPPDPFDPTKTTIQLR